jgi:hypothetical protein
VLGCPGVFLDGLGRIGSREGVAGAGGTEEKAHKKRGQKEEGERKKGKEKETETKTRARRKDRSSQ